jgi:NADH-quinone oxidoreductase subunit C
MSETPKATEEEIVATIRERIGNLAENVKLDRKDRISLVVNRETASETAVRLRELGFDHTIAVSGVDYLNEKRMEVVYFLSSYSRDDLKHLVISLKVQLDRENPTTPALTPIWESANLFEREASEMYGISFEGHPGLRRLLLQDNWDGPPPMRKDLKIPELA